MAAALPAVLRGVPLQQYSQTAAPHSAAAAACTNVHDRWPKKLNAFYIEYANDATPFPGMFLSGATLNAVVVLNISKPMSIVRIVFRCEGFVNIADKKQTVIREVKTLFGYETGRKCAAKKPAGQFKFPVSLYLPPDLPSTLFESPSMHVRYICQAVLCCRNSSRKIVMERPFGVHHHNALVVEEVIHSQSPQHHRTEFNGLSATISLNRTGFYVGDSVTVTGTITNNNHNSRKVCVGLELIRSIVGQAEYWFLGFVRTAQKKKVARVANRWGDFAKIPSGDTKAFSILMDLHNIEPTERHRLLTLEYILHVTFVTKHGLLGKSAPKYATFAITIAPNVPPTDIQPSPGLASRGAAASTNVHLADGEPSSATATAINVHAIATEHGDDNSTDLPPSYDTVIRKVL